MSGRVLPSAFQEEEEEGRRTKKKGEFFASFPLVAGICARSYLRRAPKSSEERDWVVEKSVVLRVPREVAEDGRFFFSMSTAAVSPPDPRCLVVP